MEVTRPNLYVIYTIYMYIYKPSHIITQFSLEKINSFIIKRGKKPVVNNIKI